MLKQFKSIVSSSGFWLGLSPGIILVVWMGVSTITPKSEQVSPAVTLVMGSSAEAATVNSCTWRIVETRNFEKAKSLADNGWEPYAVTDTYRGAGQIFYLRRK
jgi:hypothetical protein